jgi:excisionase family DNA binding protein
MVARMHTHTPPNHHSRQRRRSAAEEFENLETADVSRVLALPPRLLEADEVAGLLGVPRSFVYALARRGELPTVRIGERYVRFRTQALERWIAEQESTRPKGTQ